MTVATLREEPSAVAISPRETFLTNPKTPPRTGVQSDRWEALRAEDRHAAVAVVGIVGTILSMALLGYAVVVIGLILGG